MALHFLLPLLRLPVGCQVSMILQPDSPNLAIANHFSAISTIRSKPKFRSTKHRRKRSC